MDSQILGSTELSVTSFGIGCATFGREIDQIQSFEILDHAMEKGITLVDTAAAYSNGDSESIVGNWIADRNCRDQIVLATKVSGELTKKKIIDSAEQSLIRLKTDCIDLFQLHVWDDMTPLEESIEALNQLVQEGKVRYIGCSNFSAWQLAKALLISCENGFVRINSVQPPYNLVQRDIEADLLPLCEDQKIGIISYSPLAAGFLTGKYQRNQEIPAGTRFDVSPGHQSIYFTDHSYSVLENLEKVAEQSGTPLIQLALAWVLKQHGTTTVLIGARKITHIDQAFEAEKLKNSDEFQDLVGQLG